MRSHVRMSCARQASRPRRGAALVLAAAMLVVAFAFAAFAIDLGYIQVVQAELQNAADGAALAGARSLVNGPASARSAACRVAEQNLAGNRAIEMVAPVDVEIGIWDEATATFQPLSGANESEGTAVRVTCRRTAERGNALSLFFAPVIGHHRADVGAVATATYEARLCGRVIGLDWVELENGDVDSFNSEDGSYASQPPGNSGHVCSNGPIALAPNAYIRGNAHPGPGHSVSGKGRVTGSTTPLERPIKAPPVDPGSSASVNDNDQLPPGILSDAGFRLEGSRTVALRPGTYYIDGDFRIGGSARLHIVGPTKIFVTGNVSVEGNGITGHTPADLQFYPLGSTARFAGNIEFSGVVYAPATDVTIAGNGGLHGAVVGKTLKLEGNPSMIHYDESLEPFSKEFARGKLVE